MKQSMQVHCHGKETVPAISHNIFGMLLTLDSAEDMLTLALSL
jgi:hypothetical protein